MIRTLGSSTRYKGVSHYDNLIIAEWMLFYDAVTSSPPDYASICLLTNYTAITETFSAIYRVTNKSHLLPIILLLVEIQIFFGKVYMTKGVFWSMTILNPFYHHRAVYNEIKQP